MPYTGFFERRGLGHIIPQNLCVVVKGVSPSVLFVVITSAACNLRSPNCTPIPPDCVSIVNSRLLGFISQKQIELHPVFTPKQADCLPSYIIVYHGFLVFASGAFHARSP